ncbi:lipase secretion chaperone [Lysobacter sp. CA199]|uniref:lipase secretion chaperone n=1 Tax=Lysobacter sp. CA199 TaxID=3455608 RepID=UPI003F8D2161
MRAAATEHPDSLRGTGVDGAVRLNARGAPIADRELRRLFDYFISRIGERDEQQIRGDLKAHLDAGFAPAAVAQVMVWFDSYMTLERSAASLAAAGGDPRAAVARLRALRRERMGEAIAEAWWGDEDRYLDYTLARQDLIDDRSLDAAQRQQKLAELERTLDPARVALIQQEDQAELSLKQSEDYAKRNVPAAQRFAERERQYGSDAARRLADLDAQRAQWDRRLRDYAQQRHKIMADASLSIAQRDRQLQSLLSRGFDANERRRVDVMVRNDLLPPLN